MAGLDYAFQVPDTVAAGTTTFAFVNRGLVLHEMFLIELAAGRTLADFVAATTADARRAVGTTVALVAASKGEASLGRIQVDLLRGRSYIIVCALRDAPDKPPHTTLGMVKTIAVR